MCIRDRAEEKRADYNVTAEISGKIIMVGVQEGESPRQAGQTAVTLYNMDSMTITANIDELDIDSIEMGMEVDITQSGAETDTHYTGTVTADVYKRQRLYCRLRNHTESCLTARGLYHR